MPISELSTELLEQIVDTYPHLHDLKLAHNQISVIENLHLLPEIQSLDLSYNRIGILDRIYAELPLVELKLSYNQITDIGSVDGLGSLACIDLRHNLLSDISVLNPLTVLPSLTSLRLDGNPLAASRNYRIRVVKMFPRLQTLDLEDITLSERMTVLPSSPRLTTPSPSVNDHDDYADIQHDLDSSRSESQSPDQAASQAPFRSSPSSQRNLMVQDLSFDDNVLPKRSGQDLAASPRKSQAPVESDFIERKALEEEVNRLAEQLGQQRELVEQLRIYYTGGDDRARSRRGDVPSLQHLIQENSALEKQLRLRDVQLQSFEKVLSLQEKLSGPNSDMHLEWRRQTYKLIVQLKSFELGERERHEEMKLREAEVKELTQKEYSRREMLDQMMIGIKAENEVLRTSKKVLESDLREQRTRVSYMRSVARDQLARFDLFRQVLSKIQELSLRNDRFMAAMSVKINGFSHRITFALSRLQIASELFRKKNLDSSKTSLTMPSLEVEERSSPEDSDSLNSLTQSLTKEIGRLQDERSQLIRRLKDTEDRHRHSMETVTRELQSQLRSVQSELEITRNQLEKATVTTEETSQELCQMEAKQLKVTDELSTSNQHIQQLESVHEEIIANLKQEFRTAQEEERENLRGELSEYMEKCKLLKSDNRELAITIRQLERQISRQRSSSVHDLQESIAPMEQKIKEQQERIDELQAENQQLKVSVEEARVQAETASKALQDTVDGKTKAEENVEDLKKAMQLLREESSQAQDRIAELLQKNQQCATKRHQSAFNLDKTDDCVSDENVEPMMDRLARLARLSADLLKDDIN